MITTERYNLAARSLHAAIAVLIICNLLTGLLHEPLKSIGWLMPLHKSMGLTVLLLSVVRLVLRLTWKKPPYPPSLAAWEKTVAAAWHGVLYVLMIAMPLSGWIFTSSGPYPLSWFGLFDWPRLAVSRGDAIVGAAHEFHEIVAYVMLVLVVGHILAALRHQVLLRDNLMRRMW